MSLSFLYSATKEHRFAFFFAAQFEGTKRTAHWATNLAFKAKRKASEPYTDVSGLEEEKFESAAFEEETVTTKQWMKSMMSELKKPNG